jgi:thymidylate synthase (FAD)
MILVRPSFQVIDDWGLDPLRKIEYAGRTCYKSEEKISSGTASKFVEMIIKRRHESVLEHSNIILDIPFHRWLWLRLFHGKFFNFSCDNWRALVSGNIRAFRDLRRGTSSKWVARLINTIFCARTCEYGMVFKDLVDSSKRTLSNVHFPSEDDLIGYFERVTHISRTVKIVCDRGVSHELVRHRVASFSQESTRYCDYYGGHMTFILPPWIPWDDSQTMTFDESNFYSLMQVLQLKAESAVPDNEAAAKWLWLNSMWDTETVYKSLRNLGWKPEQARSVLPNSTKTEIVITMTLKRWGEFFFLRDASAAHPQMQEIAHPLFVRFKQDFPDIYGEPV